MDPSSRTATRLSRAAAVLAVMLLLVSACGGDTGGADGADTAVAEGGETAELPPWLDRIYPTDDQVTTATRDVQVGHDVVAPDEQIRLMIDGVDVTTYSLEGRGELVYDPDRPIAPADPPVGDAEDPAEAAVDEPPVAAPPVDLSPGPHTATVQRLRVDPESGFVEETLDEFTWDFVIQ